MELNPRVAEAHNGLAKVFLREGRFDEAIEQYRQALRIQPGYAEARDKLGKALASCGRLDEAVEEYQRAVEIRPEFVEARNDLNAASLARSRVEEQMAGCRKAVRMKPDDAAANNNLAWLLATCPIASLRDGAAAVDLGRKAERLSAGRDPNVLGTLAAAYAETGRFPEAVSTARSAPGIGDQAPPDSHGRRFAAANCLVPGRKAVSAAVVP